MEATLTHPNAAILFRFASVPAPQKCEFCAACCGKIASDFASGGVLKVLEQVQFGSVELCLQM